VTTRTRLTLLRLAPLVPVLLAVQLPLDVLSGAPGALAELHRRAPDVFGFAALATLVAGYAVTPLVTATGARWAVILRRDYGLWTCGFAGTDLLLAAALDPAGWTVAVAGKAGVAAGTLAALMLVPLGLTSNRVAMRVLGRDWKRLHRLVLPVFALVAVHLVLVGSEAVAVVFVVAVTLLRIARVRSVARHLAAWRRLPAGVQR